MTWRNIQDLPGISVGFAYDGGVPIPTTGGGKYIFDNDGGIGAPWYSVEMTSDNIADLVVTPCNIRCTATYELVNLFNMYFATICGGVTEPADPNLAGTSGEYTATGVYGDGNVHATGYDTSGPVQHLELLIEVDGDLLASELWTNFKNCVETA